MQAMSAATSGAWAAVVRELQTSEAAYLRQIQAYLNDFIEVRPS